MGKEREGESVKGKVTMPLADYKLLEAKGEELTKLWEALAKCFKTECFNEDCGKSEKGDKSCHAWETDKCRVARSVTTVDADKLVEAMAAYMGYKSYAIKHTAGSELRERGEADAKP